MSKQAPIKARLSEPMPELASGQELPREIQWMPPGEHEIIATQNGEVVKKTIRVGEGAAARLQALLQQMLAQAEEGKGDRPYFDFNHDDAEAAGHPTEIFWGGPDPRTGGIRARVEWSQPGKAALEGRAYRRFSPTFYANALGEVTGAPVNMGGLVNRAAFKTITPIIASEADQPQETMSKETTPADLPAALNRIRELETQLNAASSTREIQAKDATIQGLRTQITDLETKVATQAKDNAQRVVDAAVLAGKIPAQDKALQAKWVDTLTANPDLAATLEATPASTVAQPITARSGDSLKPSNGTDASQEHPFMAKARAYAKDNNVDLGEASSQICAAEPALYTAYCESLTAKG